MQKRFTERGEEEGGREERGGASERVCWVGVAGVLGVGRGCVCVFKSFRMKPGKGRTGGNIKMSTNIEHPLYPPKRKQKHNLPK